jgi:hypothetical protein
MNVSNSLNLLIKVLVEKSMSRSASKSNIESTFVRANLLTDWSNNEPNNTIQLRDEFHENQNYQIAKEIGISVARAKPFIWPLLLSSSIFKFQQGHFIKIGKKRQVIYVGTYVMSVSFVYWFLCSYYYYWCCCWAHWYYCWCARFGNQMWYQFISQIL